MVPTDDVADSIGRLFREGAADGLSDGELLDRFLSSRDEPAFAAIIARHGGMVLRVCREVLRDEHRAQDAFQATFLVLVRRAREVRRDRSAGPWLYGVCRRIAVRARADDARRRARDREGAEVRSIGQGGREESSPSSGTEAWPELYEELDRLPESQRAPLVLCYLEGLTAEEAARRLGCARGTILSRLARGRERMRGRLLRRGLAIPAGLLAALACSEGRAASVPPSLVESTTRTASRFATGGSSGTIPTAVATMTEGAIRPTMTIPLKIGETLLGVGLAVGALAFSQTRSEPPQAVAAGKAAVAPVPGPSADAKEGELGTVLLSGRARGRVLAGHKAPVLSVTYMADGKAVASGDSSGVVMLWDAKSGEVRRELRVTPRQGGHAAVMALAFSPDGATLAAACDDRSVRLIDAATFRERRVIPQPCFVNALAFSPDGRTLAWAGSNPPPGPNPPEDWHAISFWDVEAGKVRAAIPGPAGGGIDAIAYSADGTILASGSKDGAVRLRQAATGKELAAFRSETAPNGVAVSPDGRTVTAAFGDIHGVDGHDTGRIFTGGSLMLWDIASRARLAAFAAEETAIRALEFSPDGTILASASIDGEVVLRAPMSIVAPRSTVSPSRGWLAAGTSISMRLVSASARFDWADRDPGVGKTISRLGDARGSSQASRAGDRWRIRCGRDSEPDRGMRSGPPGQYCSWERETDSAIGEYEPWAGDRSGPRGANWHG